jgi:hypothetical protein
LHIIKWYNFFPNKFFLNRFFKQMRWEYNMRNHLKSLWKKVGYIVCALSFYLLPINLIINFCFWLRQRSKINMPHLFFLPRKKKKKKFFFFLLSFFSRISLKIFHMKKIWYRKKTLFVKKIFCFKFIFIDYLIIIIRLF